MPLLNDDDMVVEDNDMVEEDDFLFLETTVRAP